MPFWRQSSSHRPEKNFWNKSAERDSYSRLSKSVLDPSQISHSPAHLLQCGFRYALSLTQNTHEAEDLVQEAWLRLARRYSQLPSRALLFVAIRNAFIDQTRRRSVRTITSLEELTHESAAPSRDYSSVADVESLLQSLRPSEREALYLHHIEGHTAEEIAKLTKMPRNTVLSILHRSMKKLQVSLKD